MTKFTLASLFSVLAISRTSVVFAGVCEEVAPLCEQVEAVSAATAVVDDDDDSCPNALDPAPQDAHESCVLSDLERLCNAVSRTCPGHGNGGPSPAPISPPPPPPPPPPRSAAAAVRAVSVGQPIDGTLRLVFAGNGRPQTIRAGSTFGSVRGRPPVIVNSDVHIPATGVVSVVAFSLGLPSSVPAVGSTYRPVQLRVAQADRTEAVIDLGDYNRCKLASHCGPTCAIAEIQHSIFYRATRRREQRFLTGAFRVHVYLNERAKGICLGVPRTVPSQTVSVSRVRLPRN